MKTKLMVERRRLNPDRPTILETIAVYEATDHTIASYQAAIGPLGFAAWGASLRLGAEGEPIQIGPGDRIIIECEKSDDE